MKGGGRRRRERATKGRSEVKPEEKYYSDN